MILRDARADDHPAYVALLPELHVDEATLDDDAEHAGLVVALNFSRTPPSSKT